MPSFLIPLPCFKSLVSSRRELLSLSATPIFAAPAQETTLYLLDLVASRDYAHSHTALCIFLYFKSSCLGVWIPVFLNLSADSDPPYWDIDRSSHTLSYWQPLKIVCLYNNEGLRDNARLGQS